MSMTEARISVESARASGQETMRELMELLAPDRKPRLQSFCHAKSNEEPCMPDQLKTELARLVSEPATATPV